MRHTWLQEAVAEKKLKLEHLRGEDNPADLLTKGVPRQRFQKLRGMLGMRSGEEEREINMVDRSEEEEQPRQGGQPVEPSRGPAARAAALRGEATRRTFGRYVPEQRQEPEPERPGADQRQRPVRPERRRSTATSSASTMVHVQAGTAHLDLAATTRTATIRAPAREECASASASFQERDKVCRPFGKLTT